MWLSQLLIQSGRFTLEFRKIQTVRDLGGFQTSSGETTCNQDSGHGITNPSSQ